MRARCRPTFRSPPRWSNSAPARPKRRAFCSNAAPQIAAYVPVDISAEFLAQEAAALRRDVPNIAILPVAADFTRDFDLPAQIRARPRVGFFPGSTIGNFEPEDAAEFLRQAGRILGHGATMIVGVDCIKDEAVLNAAYDDAAGVTAKFNLNVLRRMNRELGGNFDLAAFRHRAFYNVERSPHRDAPGKPQGADRHGRGAQLHFAKGETIHTENSYKYTVESLPRARRERRLASGRDMDRREGLFRSACAEAVGLARHSLRPHPEEREHVSKDGRCTPSCFGTRELRRAPP